MVTTVGREAKTLVEQIREYGKALTVPVLAKMLSVSKQSLYEQVERGSLPALRIGTSIRLDPKITAAWLEARSTTV